VLKLAQLAREIVATETARLRLGVFNVAIALLMLVIAAMISLAGGVFLLSGIYQSLLQVMPPWEAGGIITLLTLLVAALLLLWARRWLPVGRRSPAAANPPTSEVSEELRQAAARGIKAGEELKRSLGPIDLVLSAFIAGMVVSRSTRAASLRRKTRKHTGP
jgi:Kef-type K+ transport system membrane component KefB